jgi:hypothetical protein
MYAAPVGGAVGEVGAGCTEVVWRAESGGGCGASIHVVASCPSRCWGIPHWRQNFSPSSVFRPQLGHQLAIRLLNPPNDEC